MQEFPQHGFVDFFSEPLTDEELQKTGGSSLVFLDNENRVVGWTDMILPDEFGPVVFSPVPPYTKPGDPYSYPQS